MTLDLRWSRIRLDATTRPALDRAIGALSRKLQVPLGFVRDPSGKIYACRVDDLWICQACQVGVRSPQSWTVVVDTRPEPRTLLPLDSVDDFAECCDLLGLRHADEQAQFAAFLFPGHDSPPTSPASGAP